MAFKFEDVTAWRHGLYYISHARLLLIRAFPTFVGTWMKTGLRPLARLYTVQNVVAGGINLCFRVRMAHRITDMPTLHSDVALLSTATFRYLREILNRLNLCYNIMVDALEA